MIDTIKGYKDLTSENYTYSDFEHLFENKNTNNEKVIFNLNNFKITISFNNKKAVRLSFNGSLPKFYYGNNLAQLDWITLKKAIDFFSDNLGVNIYDAILTRVDFGINIILNDDVKDYLFCLSDYPRKNLLEYKTSKKFFTNGSALSFYDKKIELKNKQKVSYINLPEVLLRNNILRYEIELKSSLNKMFKKDTFIVKDLLNKDTQKTIQNKWIEMYYKTNKYLYNANPIFLIKERNGIYKYLSYFGIEKLKQRNVLKIIERIDFKIKTSSSKKSKLKSLIRKLSNEVNEKSKDSNLILELDEKMNFIKEKFFIK